MIWCGMFVIGCLAMVGATVGLATHHLHFRPGESPLQFVLSIYGFFGVWTTFTWRNMSTGLYVADAGVRIRTLFWTRTLAWSRIASVDVDAAEILGTPAARYAIWLVLDNGERVETPIQRAIGIGRPVFLMQKSVGPVLKHEAFDHLVEQLRQRSQRASL